MKIAPLPLYPCHASGLQFSSQRALRSAATRSETRGQSRPSRRRAEVPFSRQLVQRPENSQRARIVERMPSSWRDA